MLPRVFIVTLLATSLVVACSDDESAGVPQGGGGTTSSGTGGTTSSGTGGTTSSGTGGGGGSGGASSCDNEGFTAAEVRCIGGAATAATLYRARTAADPPYDVLSIQLWHDQGAPTGAHSFSFAGENYSTCSTCGLLGRDCVDDLFENCAKLWLVVEGELEITNNAANLTGSLTGARAVEVTIDWNSFVSTEVPNGEDWCIASHVFDATVTPP